MTIGFIGAGKMARAVALGLVRGRVASAGDLICCSRSRDSAQAFLDPFPGARWVAEPVEVMRMADAVLLAIKPQQFAAVLPSLREASAGTLVISLAAGITLARMAEWLPGARLVRTMPNTPMQVGAGASVYAGAPNATPDDLALTERILASAGRAWRVEEGQIDAITTLSGSGPAYVFHFIEALVQGAVKLGLPQELARDLALQTVLGSAQLAAQSPLAPMELAAQVKSPRGMTLAACAVLEEEDALNTLLARAMAAAAHRAGELARGEG
jgi:pyrroline-5-carboxylate reductase